MSRPAPNVTRPVKSSELLSIAPASVTPTLTRSSFEVAPVRSSVNVAAAPSPIGLVRASIEMTGSGPDGIAIGDALQGAGEDVDISDQIAAVYQWDEGAQTWLVFIPGLRDLPGLNTLTTFRTGGDYWIFATGPVAWTVTLASSRRSQDRLP